jgi:transposase InsO family protein
MADGTLKPAVRLAERARGGEARHANSLASQGVSVILALGVQADGQAGAAKSLQELIRKIAAENPSWGEEHIANELKLKLGVMVSPRTVRKYLANYRGRTPDLSQRWLAFVHNHAQAIVACDFFVVFTAHFRILYVMVIMELGRRQILHQNVTAHPSAEWTLQQFREALTEEHPYRFLIHDRDSIFSKDLDQAVTALGVRILKTPVRAPKANAFCERLVGTIRRECLPGLPDPVWGAASETSPNALGGPL